MLGADKILCLERLAYCKHNLDEAKAAIAICNTALALQLNKEDQKKFLYERASCKEDLGDLEGSLADYTFVLNKIGSFSSAVAGIERLEKKLNVSKHKKVQIWPEKNPILEKEYEKSKKSLERARKEILDKFPAQSGFGLDGVQKCAMCLRVGVKLYRCAGCNAVGYCSKECQKQHWKAAHKQNCKDMKQAELVINNGATIKTDL